MMAKCLLHLKKLLSFLRYLNFCPDFFDHVGKGLDKKDKVSFKIFLSQPGKKTIAIQVLHDTSRNKGKQ